MTQPIFFKRGGGLTLGEIAALTGAEPRPGTALDRRIRDVAALDRAGPQHLAFLDKRRFAAAAAQTRAGVCLVTAPLEASLPPNVAVLRVGQPYRAFVTVIAALYPDALRPSSLAAPTGGIAPGAYVDATARLEDDVTIDPGAVIGAGAEIGSGTVIAAGAAIGPGVRIGRDCSIGASATIVHALIGDGVVIHPGCRIGQDGFGFVPGARHQKVPQLGRVIIQDHVEIGANTTIDRGGLRDTVIGEGSKIDNLVQIGHNVHIGRHCLIVAHVGVSGSAAIGDYVVLGGQVGVADHAQIGAGAQIAAQSGVMGTLDPGGHYGGSPAVGRKEWLRQVVELRRLGRQHGSGGQDDGDKS